MWGTYRDNAGGPALGFMWTHDEQNPCGRLCRDSAYVITITRARFVRYSWQFLKIIGSSV